MKVLQKTTFAADQARWNGGWKHLHWYAYRGKALRDANITFVMLNKAKFKITLRVSWYQKNAMP